jgi:hypothetical protein
MDCCRPPWLRTHSLSEDPPPHTYPWEPDEWLASTLSTTQLDLQKVRPGAQQEVEQVERLHQGEEEEAGCESQADVHRARCKQPLRYPVRYCVEAAGAAVRHKQISRSGIHSQDLVHCACSEADQTSSCTTLEGRGSSEGTQERKSPRSGRCWRQRMPLWQLYLT